MSAIRPEAWKVLSPYLDEALTLTGADRVSWLSNLERTNPELGGQLRELLKEFEEISNEGFLEQRLPTLPPTTIAGQTVGQYTLLSRIGEGGMGSVWLAERSDGRFERRAALKFLNIALARNGQERFRREGSILARLTHPHIAQLLDAGVAGADQPYLVLEYVDGEPVDAYCDSRKLDIFSRIRLFLDVLSAVAHAHANLIVHRDIKPSNVLVTSEGQVKLLDFGIAKMLEEETGNTTQLTRNDGGALTPEYAAPEQITRDGVTTATDVYALGNLLYLLLTGRHPAGPGPHSPAELVKTILETEAPRPSDSVSRGLDADAAAANRGATADKLQRFLRGDLDTIVAKALKKDPRERYPSASAFGADLERYLNHEPISARPDSLTYRAAKFIRRNWIPLTTAAATTAALSIGLYAATSARNLAQRRFAQVRQFANSFIELDNDVRELSGSTNVRKKIVAESLEYLTALGGETPSDPDLAFEIGNAYLQVARVQGVPTNSNLGQYDEADQSLQLADKFMSFVITKQPTNRRALLASAEIAHDWMTVVDFQNHREEALRFARLAEQHLDRFVGLGHLSPSDVNEATHIYSNLAVAYQNNNRYADAIRLSRRAIEISAEVPAAEARRGAAFGVLALSLLYTGDLDGALAASQESSAILERSTTGSPSIRLSNLNRSLRRQAEILDNDTLLSMGRTEEAATLYRRVIDGYEKQANENPNDSRMRLELAIAYERLALLVRHRDSARAMALFDHGLARARESKARNTRILIAEANLLDESAYAARTLRHEQDAQHRIQGAFEILRTIGEYPASKIEPGEEVDRALRARADDFAETGQPKEALATYEELLHGIIAWKPDPESDFRDAEVLADTWLSMAQLDRRLHQAKEAEALESQNREMWDQLNRKYPSNSYILKRMVVTSSK